MFVLLSTTFEVWWEDFAAACSAVLGWIKTTYIDAHGHEGYIIAREHLSRTLETTPPSRSRVDVSTAFPVDECAGETCDLLLNDSPRQNQAIG
jgi:hypothetical protein